MMAAKPASLCNRTQSWCVLIPESITINSLWQPNIFRKDLDFTLGDITYASDTGYLFS